MKATGIVRRIDELGRVVIPKEIRRTQRIRRGDPLEIFTTGDGEVIFKKYSPIGEMNAVAAQYTEVLSKSFALTALVADRDLILTVSGSGRRELADRSISQPLEKLMDGRRLYQSEGIAEKCILPCAAAAETVRCCGRSIILKRTPVHWRSGRRFMQGDSRCLQSWSNRADRLPLRCARTCTAQRMCGIRGCRWRWP